MASSPRNSLVAPSRFTSGSPFRYGWLFGLLLAFHALPAMDLDQLKKMSIEELMELEVTSVSRSPIALSKAPSALQVLTNWDVRRSGATNLPEALRLATNLNVARKNTYDWGISARGFNAELANKLLVMIDGRAVYTPLWSGVRWDVQDTLLEDVERIEVISGPGGSVWGANAVNGIINITTKSAEQTQGFYAEAGLGTQLESAQAFRYGGQLAPQVFFRIYGKRFERDPEAFADENEAGDYADVSQGGFRLDAVSDAADTFTFQGDYYRGFQGVLGAGTAKVAGGNLLSRWTRTLAGGGDLRLQFYYDRAFLRLPTAAGPFAPAGRFLDDLETYDWDFQHHLAVDAAHTVVWGLGYRFTDDESQAAPSLGFSPPRLRQNLFSGFMQDQLELASGRILTLGTKLEHTHYTGWEIEPSVRLQQDLASGQLVWGAISRAVRTPSRIDRDVRQPSSGLIILQGGGDAFDSESVLAYEAGLRGRFGRRVAGSVSVFYNDYRNLRSVGVTPVTVLPLVIGNQLEAQTHGVELSFDADLLNSWRLYGGYSMLRGGVRVRPGGSDINNALNETSDPGHQASLGSSVDLNARTELDLHLRWVDSLESNGNGQVRTLPGYIDLNLRVAVRLTPHVELSLTGKNLLDSQHPEYWPQGSAPVEINRSFFAKVAWQY